ncbi:hypothetical protein DHEL01_v207347 [Diaporthe helianthi]|uniref:Uncharacterized protein n=1 Tax=Diaporthe helianthi TaxID=158607 RepID=A0A2P5HVG9_DIAHE|nr:hypothetical protein DHEL01_v207347 [Diaporthe helianthi]
MVAILHYSQGNAQINRLGHGNRIGSIASSFAVNSARVNRLRVKITRGDFLARSDGRYKSVMGFKPISIQADGLPANRSQSHLKKFPSKRGKQRHQNVLKVDSNQAVVDYGHHVNMEMDMDMDMDEDTDMIDIDSDVSSIFSSAPTYLASTPSTPSTPMSAGSSFTQTIAQTPTPANNAFAPLPGYSKPMNSLMLTPTRTTAASTQPATPNASGVAPSNMPAAATQQQQQKLPAQAATIPDTPPKNGLLPFTMQAGGSQQQQQPAQAAQAPAPASRMPQKNGTIPFNLQPAQQQPAQATPPPAPASCAPQKNGAIPSTLQPATTQQQPTPPSTPPTTAATGAQPKSGVAPVKTQAASQAAQPTGPQPVTAEPRQQHTQPVKPEAKADSAASVFKADCLSTIKVASYWQNVQTWDEIRTSARYAFRNFKVPSTWPKVVPPWKNDQTLAQVKADILHRDMEAATQLMLSVHISDPDTWDFKDPTTFSMFIGRETGRTFELRQARAGKKAMPAGHIEVAANDTMNAYSKPFAVGANWSSAFAPPAVSATNPQAGSTAVAPSIGFQSTTNGTRVAAPSNVDLDHIKSILSQARPFMAKLKKNNSSAQTPTELPNQNNKPSVNAIAYPAAPVAATVSFFGQKFSLTAPPTTKGAPSQEMPHEVGSDNDPNVDNEFDFAKYFSRRTPTAAPSTSPSAPDSPPPSPSAQLFSEAAAAAKPLPSVETSLPIAGPSTAGPSTTTATAPAAKGGYLKLDNGHRYDQAYATKMMRRMILQTVPRITSQILFPAPNFSKSDQEDEAKIIVDEILARELNETSLDDITFAYERKDTLSQTALKEVFRDWFEDSMLKDLRRITPGRLEPDEEVDLMDAVASAATRYMENHSPTDSLDSDDEYDSDGGDDDDI